MITLRNAQLSDLKELQQLFVETITSVCKKDYTSDQIKVWCEGVSNTTRWITALNAQFFLVAERNGIIVGYGSLDHGSYLDFFYIHKDFQRQGIAQQILTELIQHARQSGTVVITSDVSKTARPFFEKNGFKILAEQSKIVNGIEISNYRMEKYLDQKF